MYVLIGSGDDCNGPFVDTKFSPILQEVNMNLAKFDELDVLIKGILFAETHNPTECYYFENASKIS